MSEFEQRINRIIISQRSQDRTDAAEIARLQQEADALDSREARAVQQVRQLGMTVVRLLDARGVQPKTIWQRTTTTPAEYQRIGKGWHIYTPIFRGYASEELPPNPRGLTEDGIPIEIYHLGPYTETGAETAFIGAGDIVSIRHIAPAAFAESAIRSSQFESGIASLVRGAGPYIEK